MQVCISGFKKKNHYKAGSFIIYSQRALCCLLFRASMFSPLLLVDHVAPCLSVLRGSLTRPLCLYLELFLLPFVCISVSLALLGCTYVSLISFLLTISLLCSMNFSSFSCSFISRRICVVDSLAFFLFFSCVHIVIVTLLYCYYVLHLGSLPFSHYASVQLRG